MAPRLTLLLIVRDTARVLAGLLDHHRPLCDEILVVDTGSRDATREVARRAQARVVTHPWDDDFAAARNTGLTASSGDWILILDHDERIATGDFARLREALTAKPQVYLQPTINYFRDPRHPEWRPVTGRYPREEHGETGYFLAARAGVFPRRADLRFSGRVHESILPAARRAGLPETFLDVPVHHYGYVSGDRRNRERRRRDRSLARLKYEGAPHDDAAILEWATALLEEGRADRARPLLEILADRTVANSAVTRGRFLLGRLLREEGRPARACEILATAVAGDDRLIFCWLEWLRALADGERWSEVDRVLRRARKRFGDDPLLDKEAFRYLVKTGRLAEANLLVHRLLKHYPAWAALQDLADRLEKMPRRRGFG